MQATYTQTLIRNIKPMRPREFCRIWLDANPEIESERGYRAKCKRLLANTLRIKESTIDQKWGKGIDFEGMPAEYEIDLAKTHILLSVFKATKNSPELRKLVAECIDWPQLTQ